MPLTTLDPVTALIVIDLQNGIADDSVVRGMTEVVEQTRTLLRAFRKAGLPVALVNVAGRPPGRTEKGLRSGRICCRNWIGSRMTSL